MTTKAKLIDEETIAFLHHTSVEDNDIVKGIGLDRRDIEFKYQHTERLNNWRTDELYIARAQEVEGTFLEKMYDEEHENFLARQAEEASEQVAIENDRKTFGQIMNDIKDLKLQCLQNRAAADMRKSAKKTVKERRQAVRDRLARLEIRQERERRSLSEAHARKLKDIKLSRNIVLRDIEDPELRIIINGNEYNDKTLAAENAKMKVQTAEQTRVMNAKIFTQLVQNTKEIEQLREIHLLGLKHTTKYCDIELEAMDEFESLVALHTTEEQKLEAELKAIADKEETNLQSEMTAGRAKAAQAEAAHQAALKRAKLKKEARQIRKQQRIDARERERQFWAAEEELLNEHLLSTYGSASSDVVHEKALQLLDRSRLESNRKILDKESSDDEFEDYLNESILDNVAKMTNEASALDKQFAREMFKIENMRKMHKDQLHKVREHNRKFRETLKKTHAKTLREVLADQEVEVAKLQEQQEKEMNALMETQKSSEKADDDNRALNHRLNGMLPRFVVDAMKKNEPVEPKAFQNLMFLTSDIVSFTSLSSESTAAQVISLLNRLYTAMDDMLDSFHDVFKLETIGDAYCIVSGLNSQERSPRLNAIDIAECALGFIDIIENLDMSDQVKDKIEIRVGIHCGDAVGGVGNINQPNTGTQPFFRFSLFGDTVTTTGLLEQSSKPNCIHLSGAIYDLIKDDYEFDVSETLTVDTASGAKKKVPTYWLAGRKNAVKTDKKVDKKSNRSRSITFEQ
ncbi:Nitrogen permease regulator 2 [Dinochytrium kinnereticum]|nr:Nitrogen permease regulator 2 [Dinochytrium kinnereticum]